MNWRERALGRWLRVSWNGRYVHTFWQVGPLYAWVRWPRHNAPNVLPHLEASFTWGYR